MWEAGRMLRSVVIEFDSVEAVVAAYESRAYRDALAALDGGVIRDVRIIPGV